MGCPLPLKVLFLIASLGIVGGGLGVWLLFQARRSLRHAIAFLLFCALAYALGYVYIPCFDLSGATLCHGPTGSLEKTLALTFDDGPQEPYTPQILDVLKRENVPATFFVLGKYVRKHPETVRRLLQEGHAVGNHGDSHTPLAFQDADFARREIEGWEAAMAPIGLPSVKLFRASHGWKNPWLLSLLREKGYRLIGWSVGVWDSDRPGSDVLWKRLQDLPGGSIVLLHDGDGDREGEDRSQTVAVLTPLIRHYKALGFRFVTVPELLKY